MLTAYLCFNFEMTLVVKGKVICCFFLGEMVEQKMKIMVNGKWCLSRNAMFSIDSKFKLLLSKLLIQNDVTDPLNETFH